MSENNIDLSCSGLKLGIIGTNFISDQLCEAALMTGLKPSAVYSRSMETGTTFAEKYGIENVYCDFEEFCTSDKINAAYVASPNFCHYHQTIKLLDAGKHVLCEKPAAESAERFRRMRRLAEEKGLCMIEAMRPAYDPAVDMVRSLIPECGDIRYAHIEFSQYSSRYDRFKAGVMTNAFDTSYSNAAVMDIGVYALHVCALLFGKPDRIISHSYKLAGGFEGQGNAVLAYDGKTVDVAYSKITEAHSPSFVRGENAEITFGHALSKINEIRFFDRIKGEKKVDFCPAENNMIYELSAFCDFIGGKKNPSYYLDCTEITLEMMDEIRKQNQIIFPSDSEE